MKLLGVAGCVLLLAVVIAGSPGKADTTAPTVMMSPSPSPVATFHNFPSKAVPLVISHTSIMSVFHPFDPGDPLDPDCWKIQTMISVQPAGSNNPVIKLVVGTNGNKTITIPIALWPSRKSLSLSPGDTLASIVTINSNVAVSVMSTDGQVSTRDFVGQTGQCVTIDASLSTFDVSTNLNSTVMPLCALTTNNI